jgi:hypothetical protein
MSLASGKGASSENTAITNVRVISMNFDQELLQAALVGLEMKRAKLDEQIAFVRSMTTGKAPGKRAKAAKAAEEPATEKKPRKKRRNLSPEARQRIAEAQKKRWAAARGE